MDKSREEYTRANRAAWNQVAPRHAEQNNAALFEAFKNPAHVSFDKDLLEALLEVGVEGKKCIQLCCNNGRETLSLHNLGAAHCIGVDGAEAFVEHGRQLIEVAGAAERVEMLHSDVYELPGSLDGAFDIVLTTAGVLSWLPDLDGFFDIVQRLLKPGGRLVMEEMHPVLFMYEPNPETGVSAIEYPYFNTEVWEETDGLDYYGDGQFETSPHFSFMHRLDQIFMAATGSGLNLRFFKELDYDISAFCADLEDSPAVPPLGFILVMQKAAAV